MTGFTVFSSGYHDVCYHSLPLPYGALVWSAVFDCDISWLHSHTFWLRNEKK